VSSGSLEREVWSNARRLRIDERVARSYLPAEPFSLTELLFEEIHDHRADLLFQSLHYLRSARKGSLNFALVDPKEKRPVSLVSLSPLEWACVKNEICGRTRLLPETVWEVSRMYSVDDAPTNSISYLLGKVRIHLRQRSGCSIELLATTVDPNLGFTGSSYRAANWQHWMSVKARPYIYEWGTYVTPRQLREWYGTSNVSMLKSKYPGRFEQSRVRLLDSYVYCCSVRGLTETMSAECQRVLHRRPMAAVSQP